jgi:hypothetical protein
MIAILQTKPSAPHLCRRCAAYAVVDHHHDEGGWEDKEGAIAERTTVQGPSYIL